MEKHYNINFFNNIVEIIENNYLFLNDQKLMWKFNVEKFRLIIENKSDALSLYTIIDELLLTLNDPHTRLIHKEKIDKFWDVNFVWIGNSLYLVQNINGYKNDIEGSKVLKINDMLVADLLENYNDKFFNFPVSLIKQEILKELKTIKGGLKIEVLNRNNIIYHEDIGLVSIEEVNKKFNTNIKQFNVAPIYIKSLSKDTIHLKVLSFRYKGIKEIILNNKNYIDTFNKIIIDIRDNSGGFINEAKELVSLIIDNDVELDYMVKKRNNNEHVCEKIMISSKSLECFRNKKVFVLCNENTMSSAEYIFLKSLILDNKVKKIIGTQTAGLSGQAKVYSLVDDCVLQVTNTKYLDSNDMEIKLGICPNIKVNNKISDFIEHIDTQLVYCMSI